ncbi:elongation factor G [Magnetospira sp. QH-2]|uniref:elongation factor G n=1 Tax=Magnetospira sp. (strain QH-2) TaxID=1288970 RepID=UPI0003E814C6|nr:elongation factor G [Magnetospira sp. QH-2]CCQ75292.1 putative Elongation factor G-like protein [Magnetospira sp. QH-2]
MPNKKHTSGPRVAAIVGPYTSGKTTLLEAMLFSAGITNRKGRVTEGSTVGDSTPEARDRQMSTELNIASGPYLGEQWTFIDCPGNVELSQDAINALMVADTAVVVCEPGEDKALAMGPLLKFLDDHAIPHVIFINKMDNTSVGVKATLEALQVVSERPLVLRELPIRDGDKITGFIDLVSERAFEYQEDKPSKMSSVPDSLKDEEHEEREHLLEALADYDDHLMEELLEEVVPDSDEVYENMARDLQQDLIVPVFFGSALHAHGVTRLLKALRHEAPEAAASAERMGFESSGEPVAQVFKTLHAAHTGKLSIARVWRGEFTDGMQLGESKVSGLFSFDGGKHVKTAKAPAGAIVGLGRMEEVHTGAVLSPSGKAEALEWPEPLTSLFSLAINAEKREDEVKLSGALAKLAEEDPSLSFGHDPETHEFLVWGQGSVHLQVAVARLRHRYNITAVTERPQVAYRETIRKSVSKQARHKKQSGGHGEFGEVHLTIKPLPRGSGIQFKDTITGGAVPKQYIPAVEAGMRDHCASAGPLGFPIVDIEVTLTDGKFHTVDSSDMAFRKAAQQGMREGMPECEPVLLEPICSVDIAIPNEFTSRVQRLVSGRRGQILGYQAKEGWNGWDEVQAYLPQAEMHDMIVELRSMTLGVGTFSWSFDHLQELMGRVADQIVAAQAKKD